MSEPARRGEAAPCELHRLTDDGRIPNNARLPLIIYRSALPLSGDPAAACEALFDRNGWGGAWRNGIYPYHHYHATTHEALGIVRGNAQLRVGGESGPLVELRAGDVVIIPAGVAHKNEGASRDLLVVGAYPEGRAPDMCREKNEDRKRALESIPRVAVPRADPVYGADGPLTTHWRGG